MNPDNLHNRIYRAHTNLRLGMGVIALVFPIILVVGGWILTRTPWQTSLSAYYHTPMRDVFVGILFAVGAFLYLYKGFSSKENVALNWAGAFAVGVALFPMEAPPNSGDVFTARYPHAACAILFFIAIAYVCIFRASDTVYLIHGERRAWYYRMTYKILGILMIVFPVTAALLFYSPEAKEHHAIFAVEVVSIWIFSFYWLLKSSEISSTQADRAVPT